MHELVVNLHMHTTYSDGHGSHADLAQAAMQAGLDAILVTDHNVYVSGVEGYFKDNGKRVLVLVGEEIHDPTRQPQKNHLLVFNAGRELAGYASHPQGLIDQVRQSDGLSFIAHPIDLALPSFGEDNISWVDWQVQGYTGIELWNGFSELKTVIKSKLHALFYAFYPEFIPHGPHPETLHIWDELTTAGQRVVAVGGSDAHAQPKHLGPIHRTVFPYEYHFRSVNTHLWVQNPLTSDLHTDRKAIMDALQEGHAFIGLDLFQSTRGFRFLAHGKESIAWMGDQILLRGGVTFQIHLPLPAEVHLICNGRHVKTWRGRDNLTYITTEPGVYRVEAYLRARGLRRGWIFSNPIYVHG